MVPGWTSMAAFTPVAGRTDPSDMMERVGADPVPRAFIEAVAWATEPHADQSRSSATSPPLALALGVPIVPEDDVTRTRAIAVLLHDAVEDVGGEPVLREIRNRFGDKVADIVDRCSDSYGDPKPSWAERKQTLIDHLEDGELGKDVLRVVAADKLHNARSVRWTSSGSGSRCSMCSTLTLTRSSLSTIRDPE